MAPRESPFGRKLMVTVRSIFSKVVRSSSAVCFSAFAKATPPSTTAPGPTCCLLIMGTLLINYWKVALCQSSLYGGSGDIFSLLRLLLVIYASVDQNFA